MPNPTHDEPRERNRVRRADPREGTDLAGWLAQVSAGALAVFCALFALGYLLALLGTGGWGWIATVGMMVRLASVAALVAMLVASVASLVFSAVDAVT